MTASQPLNNPLYKIHRRFLEDKAMSLKNGTVSAVNALMLGGKFN